MSWGRRSSCVALVDVCDESQGGMLSAARNVMPTNDRAQSMQRVGTALAFIAMPLVFVFAFAVHPGLLHPQLLGPQELIQRARGSGVLHFAHALVTLNTGLMVAIAVHFMRRLEAGPAALAGFVGGCLAVLGTLALAADKGALCLTMSALDDLSDAEFARMLPGLLAIFSKHGWLVLLWGILLLPIGFGIQALALHKGRVLSRRSSMLFLLGVLLIGTPDGAEIVNLTAALLLALVFVPYGVQHLRHEPHGLDRGVGDARVVPVG